MIDRKNPNYPPHHCFTVALCEKCGEAYEPGCEFPHKCKKQNSYRTNSVLMFGSFLKDVTGGGYAK